MLTRRFAIPMAVLAVALIAATGPAHAQWTTNGVALCTAANQQTFPQITSDGTGGAIVTWEDQRGADTDIYAQRVNADGVPQWTADGVALCTATNNQYFHTITSDGAGGAIVTWTDLRSANFHIYAQRVNADGVPQWTVDGVALCIAAIAQQYPTITADGAGGAIVTWQDARNASGTGFDIYAQRVNAAGVPQWTTDGVALCTATNDQQHPTITADGVGGAIVIWTDSRSGSGSSNYDIYAQRVNAAGVPQWTADGVALCTATNAQQFEEAFHGFPSQTIIADGAGGAIVTWTDSRSGGSSGSSTYYDIYAQRVNAAGTPQWTADGVALCTATSAQQSPTMAPDGAGGAIVTWEDSRNVTDDIYAQRVNAAGAPQWTADGLAVCTDAYDQHHPTITADGAGGAIVTWWDFRFPGSGIYAQRVNAAGAPQWTADGVAVSTATNLSFYPMITADGAGGAIVTWWDHRGGSSDIYASRVLGDGTVSALASLVDAAAEPGVVRLHWYTPDGSVQRATVERAEVGAEFVAIGEVAADGAGHLRFEDHDVTAGATYQYRLAVPDGATVDYLGQVTIRVPAAATLGIEGFRPNPAEGPVSVVFALGSAAPARLELLDVAGRRVLSQEVGMLGPGQHVLRLERAAALSAGVYVLRLTQSGRAVTARSAIVR